jgi:hypothetical protein
MCGRLRIPAGSLLEGNAWGSESEAKVAVETPGSYRFQEYGISAGKLQAVNRVSPRERPCVGFRQHGVGEMSKS